MRSANVFVLTTGRSGSTSLAQSLRFARGITSGHESNWRCPWPSRLDYPVDHVEVDNRLAWLLPLLDIRYPSAAYVWLRRDRQDVVHSYSQRWERDLRYFGSPTGRIRGAASALLGGASTSLGIQGPKGRPYTGLIHAFTYGICGAPEFLNGPERLASTEAAVDVVEGLIESFLRGREFFSLDCSELQNRVDELWAWLGLEGDLDAARNSLRWRHNVGLGGSVERNPRDGAQA